MRYRKVIFVDENDNSRAPMAKIIMNSKFLLEPMDIESRGLVVLFSEPMNQKAEAVLVSNGYNVTEHRARQLTQKDIAEDVLILTMEERQKTKIWENYENARNVYTLPGFVGLQGELPPLYGEPLKEYGRCYEAIEALVGGLIVILNEEKLRSNDQGI